MAGRNILDTRQKKSTIVAVCILLLCFTLCIDYVRGESTTSPPETPSSTTSSPTSTTLASTPDKTSTTPATTSITSAAATVITTSVPVNAGQTLTALSSVGTTPRINNSTSMSTSSSSTITSRHTSVAQQVTSTESSTSPTEHTTESTPPSSTTSSSISQSTSTAPTSSKATTTIRTSSTMPTTGPTASATVSTTIDNAVNMTDAASQTHTSPTTATAAHMSTQTTQSTASTNAVSGSTSSESTTTSTSTVKGNTVLSQTQTATSTSLTPNSSAQSASLSTNLTNNTSSTVASSSSSSPILTMSIESSSMGTDGSTTTTHILASQSTPTTTDSHQATSSSSSSLPSSTNPTTKSDIIGSSQPSSSVSPISSTAITSTITPTEGQNTSQHSSPGQDTDECASNPCQSNSTCMDTVNGYTCNCSSGFTGVNCATDIDECQSNPCLNAAKCTDEVNMYTCKCTSGYNGTNCEHDINECQSNPCKNGATCSDGVNTYTCTCATGFNGTNCQHNIDECQNNPCKNGATCSDGVNTYTCTCATGFNGTNCQHNIDDCVEEVCHNGGTCNDGINGFTCDCAPEWTGVTCETDTDECSEDTHDCDRNANCINIQGSFNCSCWAGFEGTGRNHHCQAESTPPSSTTSSSISQSTSTAPTSSKATTTIRTSSTMPTTGPTASATVSTTIDNAVNMTDAASQTHTSPTTATAAHMSTQTTQSTASTNAVSGSTSSESTTTSTSTVKGNTVLSQTQTATSTSLTPNSSAQSASLSTNLTNNTSSTVASSSSSPILTMSIESSSMGTDGSTTTTHTLASQSTPTTTDSHQATSSPSSSLPSSTNPTTKSDIIGSSQPSSSVSPISSTAITSTITPTEGQNTSQHSSPGQDTDECASNPCQSNSTCIDTVNGYTCNCSSGFTGVNCATDIDECQSNPCLNAAKCTDEVNMYTCKCTSGYNGTNCEHDINECQSNPCKNGATCSDGVNTYTCTCATGFNGTNCQHNIDECQNNPCKNGATCSDGVNTYTCTCATGFNGTNCQHNIDDCVEEVCHNGGTCNDGINGFTCDCAPEWTGVTCETDTDECSEDTHDCDRNANCINIQGSFNCSCWAGFEGTGRNHHCQDINECSSLKTCLHNATCFNTPGSHRCFCAPGWNGTSCDTNINECSSFPCDTNATCRDNNGSYTCTCDHGYRGAGHRCTQEVLLHVHIDHHYTSDDQVFGPYSIPGGLFYFGKLFNSFYVSMNGYITLGRILDQRYPPKTPADWQSLGFPIIAPLWSDIETSGSNSGVSISVVSNASVLASIGSAILTAARPSKSIVITWTKAVPYPFAQNVNQEKADFQAVISVIGTDTIIMFNYDQDIFTWQPSFDKVVAIGYSGKDNVGIVKFGSSNFTDVNNSSSGSVKGRWIFNVTSGSSESECLAAITDHNLTTEIGYAQTFSEPCPCSIMQVRRNMRFRFERSNNDDYSIYVSRFARQPNNHRQRCHYSLQGSLLKGYPGGGYLDLVADGFQEAHNICCSQEKTCNLFYQINPSDDCSRYSPPTWSLSWGDPHISTLDGATYTFNGLGEYTLLLLNETDHYKFNVQVRTEAATDAHHDATVFSGLVAQEGNNSKVEVLLNRTSGISEIHIDGHANSTLFPRIHDLNMTLDGVEVLSDKTKSKTAFSIVFLSGLSIQIDVSNILDIVVSLPRDGEFKGKTYGLLGNNNGDKTDDYILKNGTTLSADSSEETLYHFGSSWTILVEESLFGYYDDTKNYSYFNNDTIARPNNFISDIDNITAYVIQNCPKHPDLNVSVCGDNRACIVDTLATCNEQFGDRSKETEQMALAVQEIIDSMPPDLDIPDPMYVGYSSNTSLTLHFNVSSVLCNTSIHSYICNNTYFYWNVSQALRNSSVYLKLFANDSRGATSEYRPHIYYCGCEQEDQCDFSLIRSDGPDSSSDRFFRARCNCPDDMEGVNCESRVHMCDRNPCFENVACNHSITTGNPCGACPAGLEGDGSRCYDVNECINGTAKCEQDCHNTNGSYTCSCFHGFVADGYICKDIDECSSATNTCNPLQYCENTIGSYVCYCRPGYARDDVTFGNCINVKENTYSYVGVLVFKTITMDSVKLTAALRDYLSKIYNKSNNLSFVEIVETVPSALSGRQKRDIAYIKYQTKYIAHMKSEETPQHVQQLLKNSFQQLGSTSDGYVAPDIVGFNEPLLISTTESRIISDDEGGICNIPDSTTCDPISTSCLTSNGSYTCACKKGFYGWADPYSSCKDINECELPYDVCNGGVDCVNTPGSYTCNCPAGYIYDGSKYCTDMCVSNPCQNGGLCIHGDMQGQYVCKCDDYWTGPHCVDSNAETKKLKVIAIAVGGSIGGVCLLLLCALFGMYRRHKKKFGGYTSPSTFDFESDLDMIGPALRRKDFPLDDSDTEFSIPRPKLHQDRFELSERGATFDGDNGDGETGKMEEPKKPLTKVVKETSADGHENPSFLHSLTMGGERRASKNAQEYF